MNKLLLISLFLCITLVPQLGYAQSSCAPISGLVAQFPLDEMQGTAVQDATGQLPSGTLTRGPYAWQPTGGHDGSGALALTGNALLDIPLYWTPTAFSFSFWLKPTSLYNWSQITGSTAGWGAFLFHSTASGGVYVGTDVNHRIDLSASRVVQAGVWQHFVFTFNNGEGILYRNGQLLGRRTDMLLPAAWQGIELGSPTDAIYDDMRIYNRAISAQEASTLFSCPATATYLPPAAPTNNFDRNWTFERTYDGSGNIIAESKQFANALGRPTQAQARNAATKQVFAAQTIYSTGGQPVLQTLAAPINNQNFSYKEGFVTASGTAYGPANFEQSKTNAPDAVDATTPGTLGYYYSKQNAQEPLTPTTNYPYSLFEPYEGPLGGIRRAAGPGDEFRMGKGRETKSRDFLVRKEFDAYLQLRPYFVSGSPNATLEYQAIKTVTVNADGRESIAVTNKEGQTIITGLSGPQYAALPVYGFISSETTNSLDPNAPGYQDIHIPAAEAQDVKFTMSKNTTSDGKIRIINLLTDASTDYIITAPNNGTTEPEKHVMLAPGFYRVVSLSGTQWLYYGARYGNLSYSYYDDAGRIIATVAPNGLAGGNLLRNPGFEQDPVGTTATSGWLVNNNRAAATYSQQGIGTFPLAHSGQFYGVHWTGQSGGHDAFTYQIITGLPSGLYTARAWVKNTGIGQNWPTQTASLLVKQYDAAGSQLSAAIPITYSWGDWVQVQVPNIPVANGQCTVGLYSISPKDDWIIFDDVELVRQADNAQPTFVTRNTYDTSNRLLATESGDEGRSEYVYARDGRIRFAQNSLQRRLGRFSYSNYDEAGRVVETGEYTQAAGSQGVEFQSQLPRAAFTTQQEAESALFYNSTSDHKQTVYKAGATFVNYLTTPGDYLQFTVTVPQTGNYTLQIRYATGRNQQTFNLVVNGGPASLLVFPTSGSWNTIATRTLVTQLQQGVNTINLRVDSNTTGYVDVDNLVVTNPTLAHSQSVLDIVEDATPAGGLDASQCAQRTLVWYDLPWDGTATKPDGTVDAGHQDAQIAGRTQQFVAGAVTKTKNDNITTWYSYNELGRVAWVVQDVAGIGVKTLDYQYDFSGNALQVAYQKGQPDSFFHHYAYDAAQRLTSVSTSTDGATKTLQAEYSYYLHGPLKRVQIAGNLQGVDYTYTLQGALKGINHVTSALEPGRDAPQVNGVYKDLFALTLEYFSGDYRSRNIDITPPVLPGASSITHYDGTIQAAAWRTVASTDIQRLTYSYDEKSQLQNSVYSNWQLDKTTKAYQLNTALNTAFQEGGMTYDQNSNILSLRRTNQIGAVTDNFSYIYKTNTNQLQEVHTGGSAGATVLDYDYDETGQLIRQRDEQGQRYLTYNAAGKTTGVYTDAARSQPFITFTYDDRGFRASKTVYTGGTPTQTTYYVRDITGNVLTVYDKPVTTGVVQRSEVPLYGASRLGTLTRLDDGTQDYRYELNDHLGNARVVFHRPTTTVVTETMEGTSTYAFQGVADTRAAPSSGGHYSTYVAQLDGRSASKSTLMRIVPALKGDTITFTAWAKVPAVKNFVQPNVVANPTPTVRPFLLLGATATTNNSATQREDGHLVQPRVSTNSWLSRLAVGIGISLTGKRLEQTSLLAGGTEPTPLGSTYNAWIKYRILDDNNNPIGQEQTVLLPNDGTADWQPLQVGIRVQQGSKVELTATSAERSSFVFFDDLRVEQTGSLVVQEQHQYAFGAPLPGLSYTVGNRRYRYGYQSQFAEKDIETGYESFEARLYNSRIGRWLSADPLHAQDSPYTGLGNNPVLFADPDGKDIFIVITGLTRRQASMLTRGYKKLYATPVGHAWLSQFENSSTQDLYISYNSLVAPSADAGAQTYSLKSNQFTPGEAIDLTSFVTDITLRNAQNFNGLETRYHVPQVTLVNLNKKWDGQDAFFVAEIIGHEVKAHGLNPNASDVDAHRAYGSWTANAKAARSSFSPTSGSPADVLHRQLSNMGKISSTVSDAARASYQLINGITSGLSGAGVIIHTPRYSF